MDTVGRRTEDALRSGLPLAALVAVGAFLRFDALGAPSYWLDEVLEANLSREALTHPWWHWLTGFGLEHGPLHFAIQLLTQLGGGEATGRAPAALFGLATIVLMWFATRAAGEGRVTAAVAALLVATSPFHVYYSREARPYALLMLLATALLIAILRERIVGSAVIGAFALYTSAIAAAFVVAAAIAAFKRWKIVAVLAAIAAMFPLLYRSGPAGLGASTARVSAAEIVRAFTVSALGTNTRGHTVIAMVIFAAIGAVALTWRDRRAGFVVLTMTIAPIAVVVASVIVAKHFFALRYIAAALPPFLLLAAIGMATIARVVRLPLLAVVIAIVVARETWTTARLEPLQKVNWRGIARALETHARPGDVILLADPPADASLRFYLRNLRPGVRVAAIPYVPMAEIMVHSAPAVWIVTTYNSRDLAVREWACRYPLLLASTLEGFRLHYAPDAHHFLTERAGAPELRAVSAALGENLTIRAGTNDALFLGEGWSAADVVGDRTYRWATSTRATLSVPRWGGRDRTIAFIAAPMPPQTMRVALNGAVLGNVKMREGWQRYEFAAPASTWRDGSNDLELTFAHTAMAPNDPRTLAVLFDEISIGMPSDPAFIPPLRMPADELLQTHRDKPEPVDRAKVEALLARLGLDPAALWPAIARGDVALQDAVNTLAWGPDCEADDAFLDRAFVVLMHRHPGTFEQRDLLGRLKDGATREQILARITRAAEFRAAISSASHAPPHPHPIRR